jgi:hypothetical protein
MPKHIQRSNFGLAQSLRAASSFVTAVFPRMTFAMKPRIFVGCAKQINDLPDEFKNAKAKLHHRLTKKNTAFACGRWRVRALSA